MWMCFVSDLFHTDGRGFIAAPQENRVVQPFQRATLNTGLRLQYYGGNAGPLLLGSLLFKDAPPQEPLVATPVLSCRSHREPCQFLRAFYSMLGSGADPRAE